MAITPTKRYSPSGAPFVDGGAASVLWRETVRFPILGFNRVDPDIDDSQETKETASITFWPVEPALMVVNPVPDPLLEPPSIPWMAAGFSHSHVRGGAGTVFRDINNPDIPVGGAPSMTVVIGMSYMKLLDNDESQAVEFVCDIGFLVKGEQVNIFVEES